MLHSLGEGTKGKLRRDYYDLLQHHDITRVPTSGCTV